MKNGSVHHLGARTEGRTSDFNIPNTMTFLMFLLADRAKWLSRLLSPTSDSLLPPILEVEISFAAVVANYAVRFPGICSLS